MMLNENRRCLNSDAISVVIGVILMVAITVAVAATLYVGITNIGSLQFQDIIPKISFLPNTAGESLMVLSGGPANWEDIEFNINGNVIPSGRVGSICAGESFDVGKIIDSDQKLSASIYGTYTVNIVDKPSQKTLASVTFTSTRQKPPDPPASNAPPVFGKTSPMDSATDQPTELEFSIDITDPEKDLFTWSITCDGPITPAGLNKIQENNGVAEQDGIKTLKLTGLDYATEYQIIVTATDTGGSGKTTTATYHFTTKKAPISNLPPEITIVTPKDGAKDVSTYITAEVFIEDPEDDSFAFQIGCSNGQGAMSPGGTMSGTQKLELKNLAYSTTYQLTVTATDNGSGKTTSAVSSFTTQAKK